MKAINTFQSKLVAFWFEKSDARSYGATRILFALCTFIQIFSLWGVRLGFFGSPRMLNFDLSAGPGARFAAFGIIHSDPFISLYFLLTAVALIFLVIGKFVRPALFIACYWHFTIYYCMAGISSGYDDVMRMTGLVLLISPIKDKPTVFGLRMIQWLCFIIYIVTFCLKMRDPYWRNGQFIAYFLLSNYALFPSAEIANWEWVSVFLTHSTLLIEAILPFLLWMKRTRRLGLLVGFLFHLGIAFTSKIYIFSLCMLMLYPAFLDEEDWDWFIGIWKRLGVKYAAR